MALHPLGQLEGGVGQHGDLLDRLALLGVALHEPPALLPLEVVGRALERGGGDDAGLVPHPPGDHGRRGARHGRRARAVGAEPERGVVGVAVDDLDVLRRDARAPGPRSGRTSSRGPGPGSAPRCARPPCRWGGPAARTPSAMPRPRMSMCLRGPAPTPSVKNERPMPISSLAPWPRTRPGSRPARPAAARSRPCRGPAAARGGSRPSRTPTRSWSVYGNCSGRSRFFMRSSAGSMPSSSARQSTMRSTR